MLATLSLLETLREATREQHARMEAVIDIPHWLAHPKDYARLLGRYLGLVEPIEDRLADWPQLIGMGYGLQDRRKAPALRLDLSDLGMSREAIAELPRCYGSPDLESLGDVVGCTYVLECATLAGHAVAGIVKARNPLLPLRFFDVYGAATRDRWMEFLRMLHQFESISEDVDEMVRGAVHTFQAFEEWMEEGALLPSVR